MPPKKRANSSTTSQDTKKLKLDTNYKDASTQTIIKPVTEKVGFFTLPREIRDIIYRYSCVHTTRRAAVSSINAFGGCPQKPQSEPVISGTCKTARKESLAMYYSQNTFAVMVQGFNIKPLCDWLKFVTPRYLKLISSFWLVFEGSDGKVDPTPWLKLEKSSFSETVNIEYRGHLLMAHRFQNICGIASSLLKDGTK